MSESVKKCPFCGWNMELTDSNKEVVDDADEIIKKVARELNGDRYDMRLEKVKVFECYNCKYIAHFRK